MVNLQLQWTHKVKFHICGSDNIIHFTLTEKERKKGIYLPIGAFITAYAREKTIRTSQAIKDYSIKNYNKDMYIYSDTDSIHTLLSIEELKLFCDIDPVKLGAWKHEGSFTKARFVRQKCYIEEFYQEKKYTGKIKSIYNKKKYKGKIIKSYNNFRKIEITCAGMPKSCYDYVTWKNFKTGFSCKRKTNI